MQVSSIRLDAEVTATRARNSTTKTGDEFVAIWAAGPSLLKLSVHSLPAGLPRLGSLRDFLMSWLFIQGGFSWFSMKFSMRILRKVRSV